MAKKSVAGASTLATLALTRLGIPFTVRSYTHDPGETDFGGEAAAALGVDPRRIFKTLLAEVDGVLAVAIVPSAEPIFGCCARFKARRRARIPGQIRPPLVSVLSYSLFGRWRSGSFARVAEWQTR